MSRYTEGVCGDGAAILDNGEPMPVEVIVARLNRLELLETAINFVIGWHPDETDTHTRSWPRR